jgi:hypothetical protein
MVVSNVAQVIERRYMRIVSASAVCIRGMTYSNNKFPFETAADRDRN